MSNGAIVVLKNLPEDVTPKDIREFFAGLSIPEGWIHIINKDRTAFTMFETDEQAQEALLRNKQKMSNHIVEMKLSNHIEMGLIIATTQKYYDHNCNNNLIDNDPYSVYLEMPDVSIYETCIFFEGLPISDIKIITEKNGQATDRCLVRFKTKFAKIQALKRNNTLMRQKSIQVLPTSDTENALDPGTSACDTCVLCTGCKRTLSNDISLKKYKFSSPKPCGVCVEICGLPATATYETVKKNFVGLRFVEGGFFVETDNDKCSGRAFAEFMNEIEYETALLKADKVMDGKRITIYRITREAMVEEIEKHRRRTEENKAEESRKQIKQSQQYKAEREEKLQEWLARRHMREKERMRKIKRRKRALEEFKKKMQGEKDEEKRQMEKEKSEELNSKGTVEAGTLNPISTAVRGSRSQENAVQGKHDDFSFGSVSKAITASSCPTSSVGLSDSTKKFLRTVKSMIIASIQSSSSGSASRTPVTTVKSVGSTISQPSVAKAFNNPTTHEITDLLPPTTSPSPTAGERMPIAEVRATTVQTRHPKTTFFVSLGNPTPTIVTRYETPPAHPVPEKIANKPSPAYPISLSISTSNSAQPGNPDPSSKSTSKTDPPGNPGHTSISTSKTDPPGNPGFTSISASKTDSLDNPVIVISDDDDDPPLDINDPKLLYVYIANSPLEITKTEILKFFAGLSVCEDEIHFSLTKSGEKCGHIFVKFTSVEEAARAGRMGKTKIGDHDVMVRHATSQAMNEIFCSNAKRTLVNLLVPQRPIGPIINITKGAPIKKLAPRMINQIQSKKLTCVKMTQVPKLELLSQHIEEVLENINILPHGVHIIRSSNGNCTGVVLVELAGPKDCVEAVQLSRVAEINGVKVTIFPITANELERVLAARRGGQTMNYPVTLSPSTAVPTVSRRTSVNSPRTNGSRLPVDPSHRPLLPALRFPGESSQGQPRIPFNRPRVQGDLYPQYYNEDGHPHSVSRTSHEDPFLHPRMYGPRNPTSGGYRGRVPRTAERDPYRYPHYQANEPRYRHSIMEERRFQRTHHPLRGPRTQWRRFSQENSYWN